MVKYNGFDYVIIEIIILWYFENDFFLFVLIYVCFLVILWLNVKKIMIKCYIYINKYLFIVRNFKSGIWLYE